jgi:hypothetical protein
MTPLALQAFAEVWVVDTEYQPRPGGVPNVHCVCASELWTGRTISLWADELRRLRSPPYPLGRGTLFVTYSGLAELLSHLSLGWELPVMVLDLLIEFRMRVCGGD